MEQLLSGISQFGFPIILSMYLLVRIEGKLERLAECIQELSRTIGGR